MGNTIQRLKAWYFRTFLAFEDPANLFLPRWRPVLAALLSVPTLLQLLLPEVAAHHRVNAGQRHK